MAKIITDRKKIDKLLDRGVETVYPDKKSLRKLLLSGRKIRLYSGYDPTSPNLHLGHTITIKKLAEFQKLGHQVIFMFGDFTAQIGDPTGKQSARKPLTKKEVLKNLRNWKKQLKKIIDPDKLDFQFNSRWLAKLNLKELVEAASHFTVQQMIEREMFRKRITAGRPIHLHEFFYPLMQAYDSLALEVDLEIGGNDQTFNMLAGRTLAKTAAGREKFVLATKLLESPGGEKMGKTAGNAVNLNDSPQEIYGKIMSWPDELIASGFEILTEIPDRELKKIKKNIEIKSINPRDLKMKLAFEIVSGLAGQKAAEKAEEQFSRIFQKKQKPTKIREIKISSKNKKIGILELFVKAGLAESNSQVRRLIAEGAIRVSDEKISNPNLKFKIPRKGLELQKGKRHFAKVTTSD